MTILSNDLTTAYRDALTSYYGDQLQGVEQRMYQILQGLSAVFDSEEYHHLPVQGETARPEFIDAVFQDIYTSLFAATSTLAALDSKIESARAEIDAQDLSVLIAGLKTQMASRMLRTKGAGVVSMAVQLDSPITLTPESEETLAIESVELSNPESFTHPVLGSVQTHATTPVIAIPINNGPQPVFPGPHTIQLVARNRQLNKDDLNEHFAGQRYVTSLLMDETVEIANTYVANPGSSLMSVTATLETPSLISLIETPFPESVYTTVELYTVSNEILRYPNADPVIFVDNPDLLVSKVVWHVDINSLPEETIGGHYYGFVHAIASSADVQVYAHLVDTLAVILANNTVTPETPAGTPPRPGGGVG